MEGLKDLMRFIWERRAWWIAPVLFMMLILGLLIWMQGSAVIAPFIYSLG